MGWEGRVRGEGTFRSVVAGVVDVVVPADEGGDVLATSVGRRREGRLEDAPDVLQPRTSIFSASIDWRWDAYVEGFSLGVLAGEDVADESGGAVRFESSESS